MLDVLYCFLNVFDFCFAFASPMDSYGFLTVFLWFSDLFAYGLHMFLLSHVITPCFATCFPLAAHTTSHMFFTFIPYGLLVSAHFVFMLLGLSKDCPMVAL